MPDTYQYTAINPKTGLRIGWDGQKWVPVHEPGAIQRGVTSLAGVPEETNINPLSKGFYEGTGDLGNYIAALKQALGGLNPVPASADAASTAMTRMKQPGITNKITGAVEYPISGIPYVGPMTVRAMEQGAQGDVAGSVGSSVAAGLAGSGMAKTAPALAEKLTPTAVGGTLRKPVQGLFDIGENFAERAGKEHEENLAKLNQEYEQRVREVGKKTAEDEATHRTKVEQAKDDYARKVAENERKRLEVSAKQTGAETKQKALTTQPRSGPVYQRLKGMADQVATRDVPKLDKDVRAAQDARWNAFRMAVGDKDVDWVPVQNAVRDAEGNILAGSPENIAIFRNILNEGEDTQLSQASVFRGRPGAATAGNLNEALGSRFMDEATRQRILSKIGGSNLPEASSPIKETASIPFDDARGYYTELNQKIYRNRSLPGDVRRALKSVQDVAEKQVRSSVPQNQLAPYDRLKSDWSQYMKDFYDSDGALSQLKDAATSDGRLNLITGSKGENIIDALGRYSRFNPNVTGLAGKLRSLVKQVRELPSGRPTMPGEVRPPRFPAEPHPRELPPAPAIEPLDVTKARLEKLEKMPQQWSQLRPYQAVIPWYWPRLIAQKLIGELLSHPEVRRWIAGAK